MTATLDPTDALIGTPYLPGGRGRGGADCWGLVRLWYAARGLRLPVHVGEEHLPPQHPALHAARAGGGPWRLVAGAPRVGDLAIIRRGRALHCGVLVAPWRVLHTEPATGAVIQPVGQVPGRLLEWWRHEGLA